MAEFTLPKNSKIKPGKTIDAARGASRSKTFRVYRWDPESGENPSVDSYTIDLDKCGPMVLDAILKGLYFVHALDELSARDPHFK